jgi:F420H(2)-dependent quinone reductase
MNAAAIIIIAIAATGVLMTRFRRRWLAKINIAFTNRITSRFAARLPGFGILTHVGRKSGKVYRTPVNVFRAPEGFLIALTYGRESEWVRNVIAAGGASLRLAVCSISFPHLPSCAISPAVDFRFLCERFSGLSARTISCSFQLLVQHRALRPSSDMLWGSALC